jgi:cardiolipin synthase
LHITTPYFLPDQSIRDELVRAVQDRSVEVKVITTGKKSDQLMTRRASRRLYGELIRKGVEIYEYLPAMNHTKTLVVDGLWSIVGSTNFDPRSFGLNDEINLAARSRVLAGRIEQDFQADLGRSERITYEKWARRPPWEWAHEWLSGLIERQQ